MEDKDVLLFEVKLDIPGVKEKAELARVAISQLRKEKAATEKEFADKKIGTEEYGKSMQALETHLIRAQGQLKNYTKILTDNEKVTKSAEGSNDQLRAKLALLVPTWNAASRADREFNESIKAVGVQIRELTQELKDNEESMGDHRRSVGDYAKGIRVAGVSVGEMQESLQGGYQAFKVFTNGISLARGGLIALGAVPILLFLTGFVLLLQKSQGAMDKLAQFFKAGELALSALTNGLIKNTQIILEAFTSWNKFKNLFTDLKANAEATTAAMGDAARAGMQIAAANQQIEESEIALSVVRAKNRADIERYKKLAEDTSKSNVVRSAAAKKAYELENSTLQQSLKLQKQRIASAELEYKYSMKTRDDRKKVAEEQVRYSELEEESIGKQTELNNNLNSIRQDGITKAKEAAALAAAEEIAHYERMIILAKQKGQDTLTLEEILIKKKAAAEVLELKKGSQRRMLVEAQTNAAILARRVEHLKEIYDNESGIERARLSEARASALAGSVELENLELRESARQAQDKRKQLKVDYDTRKIDKKRYEAELADIERNADLEKQNTRNQFAAERVNKVAELGKLTIQIEQNTNEDFLQTRRNQAVAVIDLEEKQQLDLLALQELGRAERKTKEDAITAEAAAKRREVYRQILADQRADRKAGLEEQLADSKEGSRQEFEAQIALLRLQRDDELASVELTERQKSAVRAKYRREERDLEKKRFEQLIDKAVEYTNQSIGALSNILQAQDNVRKQLLDDQENAALESVGNNAEAREKIQEKFDEKRATAEKKAAEQRRKIAEVEAIINTAGAIIKAAPNPFLMALAALTGVAQIAVIESQQFARGGIIEGKSHAEGGVKYQIGSRRVELEGGEGVINKHAMAIPFVRQKASELNQMAGNGVAFRGLSAARNYTPRMEYGGVVSGASGGSSIDYGQLTQLVVGAVQALPPQVVRVVDIQNGVNRKVRVTNRAEQG